MTWYHFERKSRNEILEGTLFSKSYYLQEVSILLAVSKELKTFRSSLLAPSFSAKRLAETDLRSTNKVPRTAENNSPHSFRPGENDNPRSFRTGDSNNHSFRNTDPLRRTSAPTCVVCAVPHLVRAHPQSTTSFSDGKPCFSTYHKGELRTLKGLGSDPKPSRICMEFNLAASCQ